MEERMMDRIRDKMNKFSALTYDSIKEWLCQLLDSGESDFLTDFIKLVFEKAAAEQPFCALYAKLITELCASFPHLDTELRRIFSEFITIFVEVRDAPDVESAEYSAFLAHRERRKFRRGYSSFIGDIARLGVLQKADVEKTSGIILDGLMTTKKETGQQLLCEEYADCLITLLRSCIDIMKPSIKPLLDRVLLAMDRSESPSLSNKARFSLMDIADLYR